MHIENTGRRDLWSKKFSVRYHKLRVEHQKLYKRKSEMASVYRFLRKLLILLTVLSSLLEEM